MLFIALIFYLATGAFAQTVGLGRCPNVDVMESFSISEYEGVWYENQRSIPNFDELSTRCVMGNISQIDNDTLKLVIHWVSEFSGVEVTITASGMLDADMCENGTDCGKLIFEYPLGIVGHQSRSYSILDTDYATYSVVWICTDHILTHVKYLWILTRDSNPSKSVLDAAENVILKNRIDNVPLRVTDQTNCLSNI